VRGGSTPQPRQTKRTMLPATFCCPRCKCHALYRIHRTGLDWLMSAIGLRPVRCMTCDKRFHVRYSLIKDFDEPEGAYPRGRSNRAT
jgi:transcription elongation factor Elf1